jgi:hypothetical protein
MRYNKGAIDHAVLCFVWRIKMKYEMPTCEIVKLDVTDVITTSDVIKDVVNGETPTVPTF